jgi:pSer/pThr/pTyr-binding forkhead associated (FHA) protein
VTGGSGAEATDELRLEATAGNAAGVTLLVEERLVIGRQSEGPGKLADDPELSRHHAEITRTPAGEFTIEDLSSTNGTFVNGRRIAAPVMLAVGDAIEVGGTTLVVRAAPVGAAAAAPAPGGVDVRAATVTVDVPPAMRQAPQPPTEVAPPELAPYAEEPELAPLAEEPELAPLAEEPEPATAESKPDTKPKPVPGAPVIVRLRVDFDREDARLVVEGSAEPIELELQAGEWRVGTGGG